jgi:hypothetical protein
MTAVEVTALVEDRAKAEIECTAVVNERLGWLKPARQGGVHVY